MIIVQQPLRSICLALPAYNEAALIGELVRQAAEVLAATGLAWSIVVVDDGSRDETAAVVEKMLPTLPQLRLERHPVNRGLGPAILTCLQAGLAGIAPDDLDAHAVVCMDADLTHPPQTIPAMVTRMNEGSDVVIASRYRQGSEQHGVPLRRQVLSLGARFLFQSFLGLPGVRDYTCGFRAMRGSLLAAGFERFGVKGLITRSGFACTDELLVHLSLLGPAITEVPFILRYDLKVGASKMKLGLTVYETLKMLNTHRKMLRAARRG